MTKTNNILEVAKQLEGKKVLYFEGAGMDFEQNELNQSDVLNHRIRTSFINNDSEQIYIEMGNLYMRDVKGKNTEKMGTHIDFCFKVPTNSDDEIKYHEIFKRHEEHLVLRDIDYTKENLTKWINERLNCNFDTIHVLDNMYGYYVHGDIGTTGKYNLMENIELDHVTVSKQLDAYNEYFEWYKTYRKFPCLSVTERTKEYIKVKTHDSGEMIERNGIEREKTIAI